MPNELKAVVRSGKYYAHGTLNGRRIRQSLNIDVTEPDARRLAKAAALKLETGVVDGTYQEVAKQDIRKRTFGEARKEYCASLQREGRLTRNTANIVEMWSCLDNVKLSRITSELLLETYARFGAVKPGSLSRYIGQLSPILHYAHRLKWIDVVPDLMRPRVNNTRTTHLDEEQVKLFLSLVRALCPHWFPHMATLVYSGARLSEMLALTKGDFKKAESGEWTVTINKSANRESAKSKTVARQVPVPTWLAETVMAIPKRDALFGGVSGKPMQTTKASTVLGRVIRTVQNESGTLAQIDLRTHDLRHTFAWLWANAGADVADLKYLLGHEDIKQTMRYRGFVKPRVSKIAEKMHSNTNV